MQSDFMHKSPRVRLDEYICDLNLEVAPGGYVCYPLSSEGFSYMWGGCKATYGIRSGKVCFEVKVLEYNQVTCQDVDTHVVRVGWSTDDATLQLGEDKNSFGFGGTGKKSVNRKFANYGRRYEKGDVVGCYLAMENGWVDISYTVNGRFCGSAFKIRWMTDEALFPHVLTKNCKLEVNFGQASHPYYSLQPGYKLIDHTPPEFRISAVRPPLSQSDCEVVMMVGLPGVGKSTWAANYAKIHPSKKFFILGTDSIIDKMRVQGLHRKNNFSGRWDVLIKQATDCFNVLLKKASKSARNLILDQTNVYASARRRKVKQYREKGYTINAMVLVPRDEDLIRRSTQRTLEEGKEVPESAVLDMKANFSLPYEGENLFDNITFLELQRAEAQILVERYNREAMSKGHQSNRQKGFATNMNQMERGQVNRYYDNQPSSNQPPKPDEHYSQPSFQQSYQDNYRGTSKRPDTSDFGPPDKYRRNDPTPNFTPDSYSQQGYSDYVRQPNPARPTETEQWGASMQSTGRQPVIKEESGPVPTSYGGNYGSYRPNNANHQANDWQHQQYSSTMKPESHTYEEKAFPRQEPYGGQSTGYQPQNHQQNISGGDQTHYNDRYQPPSYEVKREPPAPSYGIKREPSVSGGWYDQGDQNHISSQTSSQPAVQPPYNQHPDHNHHNQQYGASAGGYGADVKSEEWSNQGSSQQYMNQQSYNRPSSVYDAGFNSSTGRSDNYQQWQHTDHTRNYVDTSQTSEVGSYRSGPPVQNPPSNDGRRPPPPTQYSDYQGVLPLQSQRLDEDKKPISLPKQEYGYGDMGYPPSNTAQHDRPDPRFFGGKRETDAGYSNQPWNPPNGGNQGWQGAPPDQNASWQAERSKPPADDLGDGQRYLQDRQITPTHLDPTPAHDRPLDATHRLDSSWPPGESFTNDPRNARFSGGRKSDPAPDRYRDHMTSFDLPVTKADNHATSGAQRSRDRSPENVRESNDVRRGKRDDSPPRRGGREDSHRGRGGDSNRRRGERGDSRDDSRRGAGRRGREDDSDQKRGGVRNSRDRDRGNSRDRSRTRSSRRDERDRERGRDRKRSSERSRSDRSRDERRRDDPDREKTRNDSRGGPTRSRPEDRRDPPHNSAAPAKPDSDSGSASASNQKGGLLPLPVSTSIPVNNPTPPRPVLASGQSKLKDSLAISKLSNVDFDKLRAGLATMREKSKDFEAQSSSVKAVKPSDPGEEDMELVSDEDATPAIQPNHTPDSLLSEPRLPAGPRPRFLGKVSLLGDRPERVLRPLRPRARLEAPMPRPRPRSLMETQSLRPRGEANIVATRHALIRRSLLGTPHSQPMEPGAHYTQLVPTHRKQPLLGQEGISPRPLMASRPRFRPPGVRMMRPSVPGLRPRMRHPGPRGFGRPPLIRGPPRRPLLPRYASPI